MESLAVQPSPPVRASDADRERTVAILVEHWHAGRLSVDEFEARCDEVWGAKMISGLWQAVRELPLAPPPMPPRAAGPPGRGSAIAGFVTTVTAACLLVLSFGVASFLTVPMSVTGWLLGRRGRRRGADGAHHGLAVSAEVLGFLGVVIGLLAAYLWASVVLSMGGGSGMD